MKGIVIGRIKEVLKAASMVSGIVVLSDNSSNIISSFINLFEIINTIM
jgi:hypothetical protein